MNMAVSQGSVPTDNPDARIGALIRARRLECGLTTRDLAQRVGISLGLVSQLERGLTSPSLRVLREICAAIDLPMARLFVGEGDVEDTMLVRREARQHLAFGAKRMRKELLTREGAGPMQAMLVVIEPGGGSGPDTYTHDGAEVCHVLSGSIEIEVAGRLLTLGEGDTLSFPSDRPHRFANRGTDQALVMWVVSQPFY